MWTDLMLVGAAGIVAIGVVLIVKVAFARPEQRKSERIHFDIPPSGPDVE